MSLTYSYGWPSVTGVNQLLCDLRQAPVIDGYHELIDAHFCLAEVPGAVFINFESLPDTDVNYVAAQLAWYATGAQDVTQIRTWRPDMWARVKPNASGYEDVHSNYGEYVFYERQLEAVIRRLKENPHTRQAVILFNRPNVLLSDTTDHICTTSLQFLLRHGQLNAIATMRSNELVNGFRYDVAFFTFLMDYVRAALGPGASLGWYRHNVGSLHVKRGHDALKAGARPVGVFPQLAKTEGPSIIQALTNLNIDRDLGFDVADLQKCHKDAGHRHFKTIIDLLASYQNE